MWQRQLEDAEKMCRELLSDVEIASAYFKLGEMYLKCGRENESKMFYEKAFKINSNYQKLKQVLDTLKVLKHQIPNDLSKIANDTENDNDINKTKSNSLTNWSESEIASNEMIPPEIKNDELYQFIMDLSAKTNLKHILEIGSSSGEGSTEAFVKGIRYNKIKPNLYCMEINSDRFRKLKETYKTEPFVKCYNVSSVPVNKLLSEKEVRHFYKYKKTNLNRYSIDLILSWLDQDRTNIRKADKRDNGIELIKRENNIEKFDLVLIDGSAFTGEAELREIYGASIIILDDINDIKNYNNYHRLQMDSAYTLVKENSKLRNGYAVFMKVEELIEISERKDFSIKEQSKQIENLLEKFQFNLEQSEQKLVKKLIKKGMCVFDVGANVGNYTKLFSVLTGDNGKVFAFEPALQTYNILNSEIKKHKLKNVFLENSALYSENTKIIFNEFQQKYSTWNSIGRPVMEDPEDNTKIVPIVNSRLVNAVTLDSSSFYENYVSFPSEIKSEGIGKNEILPVHFFTIVLNGMPFIEYHINVFKNLPFEWHWHIIEGVADFKNDSAWCLQNGGHIDEYFHNGGLSNDGTTKYLDSLKNLYPNNITIYRKEDGSFWNGKLEMVKEPLKNISEDCLLWQIDSDELWTAEQIISVRDMFKSDKVRTAAFFYCRYFVGEKLYISTKNTYGNHTEYEWLRVWNYKPGDKWMSHEPPILSREITPDMWVDLSKVNSFTQEETFLRKLVFYHYAYVTEAQVLFKENYYGYKDALSKWKNLNALEYYPACLKDYFDWVKDGSVVEIISEKECIAKKENDNWVFNYNGNKTHMNNFFKSDWDYIINAEAAINKNDLNGARRLLNCALNISSSNLDALNDLAVIEIIDKHYEEALKILNGIIESDSKNETAFKNKLVLENILIKNKIILDGEKLTKKQVQLS